MPVEGDFYEDDEPAEKIRAAWEAGEKQLTAPPADGQAQVNTPEAELGTTEHQFDAMWQQGIPVTITTGTSTGYQPNSEVDRLRVRVAELDAAHAAALASMRDTAATALTVDRDYMDALARATTAEAQVAAVRADLNVMRDYPMPVPTEASRLPDGATIEEAYTAGWYRAIRAHERGLRRALDAATTPPETSPTGPPVT